MSSVMARTPTVTRHSDFMAAAAAAEQAQPELRRARAAGAGTARAPPAAPGGAAAATASPPGMLSCLTGVGTTYSKGTGGWFLPPQGFLAQPEASCPLGMALLERLARRLFLENKRRDSTPRLLREGLKGA